MPRDECALFEVRLREREGGLRTDGDAESRKVVGTKQVLRALKAGTVSRVYAANDADTFIYQQVVRGAEDAGVPCVRVPSMKELGMVCGVDVPTAAAGILKS